MAGYSGTPLVKKLGIRSGHVVCAVNAPRNYRDLLQPLPEDVAFVAAPDRDTDVIHIFTDRKSELARLLTAYRKSLDPAAVLWVSWPKKAAKIATDVTEDVIREVALPLGFVDVKVCAVDEIWSGLKLVVRTALR